jgi:hypothetical protein
MLLVPTLLCPKSWEGMSGNDAQRFCTHCKQYVHNLEALTAAERLALLSTPAGKVCSRYQVAIRRAVKGREDSYMRSLLRCGAAVAMTGSVLLVLWEMYECDHRPSHYRVGAVVSKNTIGDPVPAENYQECRALLLGDVVAPRSIAVGTPGAGTEPIDHVDVKLDPVEIARLVELSKQYLPPERK